MKIIEVKNFSFRYANGDRDSLENVTLDVEEGTFNVLCGKSGCGKSTLLRLLAGLYTPSAGNVLLDGMDMRQIDPAELRRRLKPKGRGAATLVIGRTPGGARAWHVERV